MKTYKGILLFLSISLILGSCSPTTQLRKSWSDPSLANSPAQPFKKVLVMVNSKNEGTGKLPRTSLYLLSRVRMLFNHIPMLPRPTLR